MRSDLKIISIGIFVLGLMMLFSPVKADAIFIGQITDFSIDPSYDASERSEVSATLVAISQQVYFYVDNTWWSAKNPFEQAETRRTFDALGVEFGGKIYSVLTTTFGFEWRPGIDADERITVLFHSLREGAGGYTNYGDEAERILNPSSNEREMVYLNTDFIGDSKLKTLLAHEFVHLITYNQKDRLRGVTEETWLNEARAEYAVTLLGYDSPYEGSNLEQRAKDFLKSTGEPLLEWGNEESDYGVVNLFAQYLVDQYGLEILRDSLKSSDIGIASINAQLEKNGFKETFQDVFTDWTIALLVNDCNLGERYCYINSPLKDFKIVPQTNFLPFSGESTLSLMNSTKDWTGNWYRIIGGKNNLKIEFRGNIQASFQIPYIVEDDVGNISIGFFDIDNFQEGTLEIGDFQKNKSITIIPSAQTITSAYNMFSQYQFVLIVSTFQLTQEQEQELIQELLEQITVLQAEIVRLQAQLDAVLFARGELRCSQFAQNLFLGMAKNREVYCLQEFLKNQGPDVYPEGLVTGNFLSLTRAAVIRFQEKYSFEILAPLGFEKGTGFVGPATRAKLNQLL